MTLKGLVRPCKASRSPIRLYVPTMSRYSMDTKISEGFWTLSHSHLALFRILFCEFLILGIVPQPFLPIVF